MNPVTLVLNQCYDRTSLTRRYIGLHRFFSLFSLPHTEAHVRYDLEFSPCTIQSPSLAHVRYDLPVFSCTIRSPSLFLYDINLGATTTMIHRIGGAQIPIDLVSSATDSYRRSIVLFKLLSVPTSDPKSEFLYQSSSTVRNLQTSP